MILSKLIKFSSWKCLRYLQKTLKNILTKSKIVSSGKMGIATEK